LHAYKAYGSELFLEGGGKGAAIAIRYELITVYGDTRRWKIAPESIRMEVLVETS